jgi:hypothetical protein
MSKDWSATIQEISSGALGSGKLLRLKVLGNSMSPLLETGDDVLVGSVEENQLKRGVLVVVRAQDEFLTHRLIGRNSSGWLTKGDNCRWLDPPSPAIVGQVVALERRGRPVDLRASYWRWANALLGRIGAWQAHFLQAVAFAGKHWSPAPAGKRTFPERAFARLAEIPFRIAVHILIPRR